MKVHQASKFILLKAISKQPNIPGIIVFYLFSLRLYKWSGRRNTKEQVGKKKKEKKKNPNMSLKVYLSFLTPSCCQEYFAYCQQPFVPLGFKITFFK